MCSQIWRSSEFNSAQRPLRPQSQLQHAQGPEKDKKDEVSEHTEHKNQAALVAGAEKM